MLSVYLFKVQKNHETVIVINSIRQMLRLRIRETGLSCVTQKVSGQACPTEVRVLGLTPGHIAAQNSGLFKGRL